MVKRYGTDVNHIKKINKKGSLIDLMYIGVILLFFAIVVTIGIKVANEFKNNIDVNPSFATGRSREAVGETTTKYTSTIDNTFLILMIFLAIGTLVLASMVYVHPIFIPFYFVGWVLVIIFSGILSNIYQTMAADTNILATANQLTFIGGILSALPMIVGVIGILLMIILYKLKGSESY